MRLERLPWDGRDAPREDALQHRLEGEGFSVWRWSDAAGATYSPHAHDHDESLWVVSGEITFGVAGAEYRLAAGDRLMLPRGTIHTAKAGAAGATYLVGEK